MPTPPRSCPQGLSPGPRLRRLPFCLSRYRGPVRAPWETVGAQLGPSLPAPAAMAGILDLDKGCTVEELLRGCIEAFGEWYGRAHPARAQPGA